MKQFNQIVRNLKKDFTNLSKIKVALLGDSSTQFIHQAIKGLGYDNSINFSIYESDFGQIEQEIFNKKSELYKFAPEFVVIYRDSYKLKKDFYHQNNDDKINYSAAYIENLEAILDHLQEINCKVICTNLTELNDSIFGNYATKVEASLVYQIRKINFQMMQINQKYKSLYICDLSLLQNNYGEKQIFDHKMYYNANLTLSLDFIPIFTQNIIDIIKAAKGTITKCVILDLDNTLWGGMIGDDGIEKIQIGNLGIGKFYSEIQWWLKQLKERGLILAVCSKNTEEIAKTPFTNHPDMVLKLDDIAVFVANWESKADNLKYIQSVLNIGFDSMVFIDDNPYERNLVSESIPNIIVPELPEDPVEFLSYLQEQNLFETISFSGEDRMRTLQYQTESKRKKLEKSFTDPEGYLKSLQMKSKVIPFNDFTIPRVAQLTQRSNQFNLRTIRYTEQELVEIMNSDHKFGFSYSLIDKFGDNGIISILILKKNKKELFIETWVMSCRVLKRGMEYFILDHIVDFCKKHNIDTIKGEYIPTAKNALVKDNYKDLGFTYRNDFWYLCVSNYKPGKHFIKIDEDE